MQVESLISLDIKPFLQIKTISFQSCQELILKMISFQDLSDFVRVTFGEETLAENLDFVADTIGRKKGETARETITTLFLE